MFVSVCVCASVCEGVCVCVCVNTELRKMWVDAVVPNFVRCVCWRVVEGGTLQIYIYLSIYFIYIGNFMARDVYVRVRMSVWAVRAST